MTLTKVFLEMIGTEVVNYYLIPSLYTRGVNIDVSPVIDEVDDPLMFIIELSWHVEGYQLHIGIRKKQFLGGRGKCLLIIWLLSSMH